MAADQAILAARLRAAAKPIADDAKLQALTETSRKITRG